MFTIEHLRPLVDRNLRTLFAEVLPISEIYIGLVGKADYDKPFHSTIKGGFAPIPFEIEVSAYDTPAMASCKIIDAVKDMAQGLTRLYMSELSIRIKHDDPQQPVILIFRAVAYGYDGTTLKIAAKNFDNQYVIETRQHMPFSREPIDVLLNIQNVVDLAENHLGTYADFASKITDHWLKHQSWMIAKLSELNRVAFHIDSLVNGGERDFAALLTTLLGEGYASIKVPVDGVMEPLVDMNKNYINVNGIFEYLLRSHWEPVRLGEPR